MKRRFQLLMMAAGLTFFVACGGGEADNSSETVVEQETNTEATSEANEVTVDNSEQESASAKLVGKWDYLHEGGTYEFKADGTYEAYAEYEDGTKESYGSGTWTADAAKLTLTTGSETIEYPLNFMEGLMLLEAIPTEEDIASEGMSSIKDYFMEWGYKKR